MGLIGYLTLDFKALETQAYFRVIIKISIEQRWMRIGKQNVMTLLFKAFFFTFLFTIWSFFLSVYLSIYLPACLPTLGSGMKYLRLDQHGRLREDHLRLKRKFCSRGHFRQENPSTSGSQQDHQKNGKYLQNDYCIWLGFKNERKYDGAKIPV